LLLSDHLQNGSGHGNCPVIVTEKISGRDIV
jgi:hypothetical protein